MDPISFITTSLDRTVKIWSPNGEQWACINLVKLNNSFWKFPYDWVKYKLREIDGLFDIIKIFEDIDTKNLLGKKDLTVYEKE